MLALLARVGAMLALPKTPESSVFLENVGMLARSYARTRAETNANIANIADLSRSSARFGLPT